MLWSGTTSHLRLHLGQVPVACLLARVSRQARTRALRRCGARPCLVKEAACRGSLFADGVKIRSWVAIIQRLGCLAFQPFRRDSRVLARQCVRSSFLFRLAAIFMSARRPGGCPGPEVPGARVEGRLSPTAVCHISAPRPWAVLPRSSRGGHGGGRTARPEPLCMNTPGRGIGCVAFQPAAGPITSVASCPRGGDGVLRQAARSDGTPPMTARLASVIRRWVGWAARWRGRRGRDRRRWPRFRPDSRRRSSAPA